MSPLELNKNKNKNKTKKCNGHGQAGKRNRGVHFQPSAWGAFVRTVQWILQAVEGGKEKIKNSLL